MSRRDQNKDLILFERMIAAGEYFEAHEAMEEVWIAQGRPAGDLWQGLTQLAVALTHASRGNSRGARRVFAKAREKLSVAERVKEVVDFACRRYDDLMARNETQPRSDEFFDAD